MRRNSETNTTHRPCLGVDSRQCLEDQCDAPLTRELLLVDWEGCEAHENKCFDVTHWSLEQFQKLESAICQIDADGFPQ